MPKTLCASCARPIEVGDSALRFDGENRYHPGCTLECPECTTGALWSARQLVEHLAWAHYGPIGGTGAKIADVDVDVHRSLAAFERKLAADRPERSPRQRVLDEAGRIIASDRNSTYGEPEDNLSRIAQLWSVLFERPVSAREVAWAMCLLKIAREVHSPHADNPVDVAGYAALAGEVSGGAA